MYSRFSKMFNVNYGTQEGIEKGKYHAYTDSTKYGLNDSYNKPVQHNYSRLFESQFFQKIKTPEQAKVVQNTVANEAR